MLKRLSYAIGLTAIAMMMVMPERWGWVVFLILGTGVFVGGLVMCPRCGLLGANIVRLPASAINRGEIALTFDDGPDVRVTPLVLDLLDRFDVKASFFCIGEKAAAHPDLVQDIVRRGHSVENHSYHHRHLFAFYGASALKREIVTTQKALSANGIGARFFRAPMGFRSPLLDDVLRECQLEHVAWTRRGFDTVWSDAAAVFLRLSRKLSAGDILLLHDGGSSRMNDGRPVVLAVLPELLERCTVLGLRSVSLPMAFREGP
ncbi:MAG: polysaccharide deacetylase family protein [Leptospirales bacterium]